MTSERNTLADSLEFDELLIESLEEIRSGQGIEITPVFWQKRRETFLARDEARTTPAIPAFIGEGTPEHED